ncbi:MAG: metal-dependent hydrolase [Gammaproteobacteria bacterium]
MDSITQVVLGASVAAVCVPEQHRRRALAVGAVLGTLPDLDVVIDYGNAVANFTLHRGFSHSLLVLIPFAVLLWLSLKRIYSPVREAPKPWFWAIMLALVTHPLLDAHTAYGTQLFWPLAVTPTMWSTLFIIDPLYTLPLLIAVMVLLLKPTKAFAITTLKSALVISCVYLSWSWVAKLQVASAVAERFDAPGDELKVFTTPTPLNTLMWRIVVMEQDSYLEGYYHFLRSDSMHFNRIDRGQILFEQAKHIPDLQQLEWFADGFNRADVIDDQLVITDLRMGFEEHYVFQHPVAELQSGQWQAIISSRLPSSLGSDDMALFWDKFTGKDDPTSD